MARPPKQGPEMLAADASALANVLRRTRNDRPGERDIDAIARALKRAEADPKKNPKSPRESALRRALALARDFQPEKRKLFHRHIRAAITSLVDAKVRKDAA